jgi:F0F1-type ATP synthase assembly protein I
MSGGKIRRREWVRLSGIGVELTAAIAGFCLLGYWIDRHYKTAPWALLVCALLGLVGGMYNLIRESLRAAKRVGEESSEPKDDGEK